MNGEINIKQLESIFFQKLRDIDGTIGGVINILRIKDTLSISYDINSSIENFEEVASNIISECCGPLLVTFEDRGIKELKVNALELDRKPSKKRSKKEISPDAINIIYYGMANIDNLIPNQDFKREMNTLNSSKISNCIEVLEFITPIIVDKNFTIIDGVLRYTIAKKLSIKNVPIIMVDCDKVKSDFLRIALNRSSEFQKWYYGSVKTNDGITHRGTDEFIDSNPQLQPLLEPLGIFGEKILPVSFFANTLLRYRIEDYNDAANRYRQEVGLAQWAEMQRERILQKEKDRKEKIDSKIKDKGELVSLFDLTPSETDFLETFNVEEAKNNFLKETKKTARELTEASDEVARKRKEALGKEWQTKRMTASEKLEQRRAQAELKKKEKKAQTDAPLNDDSTPDIPIGDHEKSDS